MQGDNQLKMEPFNQVSDKFYVHTSSEKKNGLSDARNV